MSDQGTGYSEYIAAELEAELGRRDSVNERASKTLTSAGALVTLALAVFTVLLGKDYTLTGWAAASLVLALLCLLASAFCSVIAGFPWSITRPKYEILKAMLREHWGDTEVSARGVTAYANLEVIQSLRPGTDKKFRYLLAAGLFQVFAVALLGVSTIAVALTQPKPHAAATPVSGVVSGTVSAPPSVPPQLTSAPPKPVGAAK